MTDTPDDRPAPMRLYTVEMGNVPSLGPDCAFDIIVPNTHEIELMMYQLINHGANGAAAVDYTPPTEASLADVHAAMDGREWKADTFDEIASVLRRAGFTINPPASREMVTCKFCEEQVPADQGCAVTKTRVVVAVCTSVALTYEFDGVVDATAALDLIETGRHDPIDSNIRCEDIDVMHIETGDDRFRADRFDGDGLFYVFDTHNGGAECAGPFDTQDQAVTRQNELNASPSDPPDGA